MNHIDKEIFHQPSISKRLRPLSIWYWAFAILGIVCTLLYFTLPLSGTLSALLLGGFVIGDFCLLIVICYFLFGDNKGAYSMDCHQFLTRDFFYYPRSARQQLLDAAQSRDLDALKRVKHGAMAEFMLIRYSNDDYSVSFFQVLEVSNGQERPITDVVSVCQHGRQ